MDGFLKLSMQVSNVCGMLLHVLLCITPCIMHLVPVSAPVHTYNSLFITYLQQEAGTTTLTYVHLQIS